MNKATVTSTSERMHEPERGCMNQKVVVWNRKIVCGFIENSHVLLF
jgi:hypothetical protein